MIRTGSEIDKDPDPDPALPVKGLRAPFAKGIHLNTIRHFYLDRTACTLVRLTESHYKGRAMRGKKKHKSFLGAKLLYKRVCTSLSNSEVFFGQKLNSTPISNFL